MKRNLLLLPIVLVALLSMVSCQDDNENGFGLPENLIGTWACDDLSPNGKREHFVYENSYIYYRHLKDSETAGQKVSYITYRVKNGGTKLQIVRYDEISKKIFLKDEVNNDQSYIRIKYVTKDRLRTIWGAQDGEYDELDCTYNRVKDEVNSGGSNSGNNNDDEEDDKIRCNACKGSGICPNCGGTGEMENNRGCGFCGNWNGTCPTCGGEGWY